MEYNVSQLLPAAGQTVFFDWITIAYLVVVALLVIIGIKKGFLLMVLSFAGVAVAFAAAFFLSKPIGNALSSTGLGDTVSTSIYNWLISTNETLFSAVINQEAAAAALPSYFEQSGIPSVLANPLTSIVLPTVPEVGDKAIGVYMADGITNLAFIVGSFVLIFIVVLILIFILKKVAKGINEIPLVGWLNRLLGGVFGIAIAVVLVCVVSYGMTCLTAFPNITDWISTQLCLTDDTKWSIGKMIYEQNFVGKLFDLYLK
ncbi:MAG: CvpA family protein [Bacilli bacterium]